ncbi:hypothetical protein JCM15519_03570 [Fundidesulfovibrio butyratiphilus]
MRERDWLALLEEEAARTSIAAVARRLGYARTSVSLALSGKYPGTTDKLAATVLAVLGTVDCPHLGFPVSPARCAANSGKMPTSSPGDLRLWRACQACPHNPQQTPQGRDAS